MARSAATAGGDSLTGSSSRDGILPLDRYALGCPFWGFDGWNGRLYTRDARPADRLRQYARVFNSVEGNTTFWSVPGPRRVERWCEATPADFRFCLKVPREITHVRMLREIRQPLGDFVRAIEPLRERLGPLLLQLPPSFGPSHLARLERFLDALPPGTACAVELRHRAFFDDPSLAGPCDELLAERGCDRVVMDTRALRAGDPEHPEVLAALHEKPDLPLRPEAIGAQPLLRFVGHPHAPTNEPFLDEWAQRVAGWIAEGRHPFVFVHTASNRRTPEVARSLHRRIAARIDVGELPAFPGEAGERANGQLRLL